MLNGERKEILSMSKKKVPAELAEGLYYLKMNELKEVCTELNLPPQGQKILLIKRILTFLETGSQTPSVPLPYISKVVKGQSYPLAPDTLILSGSYKNDAATRAFFKELIGNHFHFTAFGQDWIKARWEQGNPPTYEEFADYWQRECTSRKNKKAEPKQEWAYLNFIQTCSKQHPNFSRQEIAIAWAEFRDEMAKKVKNILDQITSLEKK